VADKMSLGICCVRQPCCSTEGGYTCLLATMQSSRTNYCRTVHLTDLGAEACPENERQAPYSNVGQPFHTDTGDIIALYSLNEAECGGESQLASMATIYNHISKMRPDIIRRLSSPSWIFDR
jgi:hypothetical protein